VIRVEGRRDDILFLPGAAGPEVAVLPLALGSVIEDTPGVAAFQAIQTGPAEVTIRLEGRTGTEPEAVWSAVHNRVRAYFTAQGAAVRIRRDRTPPHHDPRTGKMRHVFSRIKHERMVAP
jgi:hypothetical protein